MLEWEQAPFNVGDDIMGSNLTTMHCCDFGKALFGSISRTDTLFGTEVGCDGRVCKHVTNHLKSCFKYSWPRFSCD